MSIHSMPPLSTFASKPSQSKTLIRPLTNSRLYVTPQKRNVSTLLKNGVVAVLVGSNDSYSAHMSCSCGRRRFIGASGVALFPSLPSNASEIVTNNSKAMLNRIHPPRPYWYEEFYALAMDKSMKAYEADVAGYKAEIFAKLKGKRDILELGIGTGPNLKYYANDASVRVFGVDPNKSMEKYVKTAAIASGLPSSHLAFIQGVGESLPVSNSSMDAVIGTLVLCSVKDVKATLEEVKRVLKRGGLYIFIEHVAAEDGTALRFIQNALDPLQQIVADGCHLTRDTGRYISEGGFSSSNINKAFFSAASLLGSHVYGVACK